MADYRDWGISDEAYAQMTPAQRTQIDNMVKANDANKQSAADAKSHEQDTYNKNKYGNEWGDPKTGTTSDGVTPTDTPTTYPTNPTSSGGAVLPPAPADPLSGSDLDALTWMSHLLTEAHLEELIPDVRHFIVDMGINDADTLDLMIRDTQAYKQRTVANVEYAKNFNGKTLSLADIVNTEQSIKAAVLNAGLPAGFLDRPEDYAKLIGMGVSPTELQDRINLAQSAAFAMDKTQRQTLHDMYGLSMGDLTAYYLDPERAAPLIEKQQAAAKVAAEARRRAIETDKQFVEDLAGRGVTVDQAAQGFGQVQRQQQFTTGAGEKISEADLQAAAFGGDTRQAERIASGRVGAYRGGGGVAGGERGVSGLGTGR